MPPLLISIFGGLFLFFFIVSPVIQIWEILKTKNSTNVSPLGYHVANLGQVFSLLYNFGVHSTAFLIFNGFLSIGINSYLIYLIGKYKKIQPRRIGITTRLFDIFS